jgi:hypothetical protein
VFEEWRCPKRTPPTAVILPQAACKKPVSACPVTRDTAPSRMTAPLLCPGLVAKESLMPEDDGRKQPSLRACFGSEDQSDSGRADLRPRHITGSTFGGTEMVPSDSIGEPCSRIHINVDACGAVLERYAGARCRSFMPTGAADVGLFVLHIPRGKPAAGKCSASCFQLGPSYGNMSSDPYLS